MALPVFAMAHSLSTCCVFTPARPVAPRRGTYRAGTAIRAQGPKPGADVSPQGAKENTFASAVLSTARHTALGFVAVSTILAATALPSSARLEGVNNPNLLPTGPVVEVIDVAGYLTKGEVARLTAEVKSLEKDTGIKLRVLAQAYPATPGLAVKDYWGVDDSTVVFVADPGLGNILNFAVGSNVDLQVPPSFWTRLASKYGNKFYWQENGESASIANAVSAIDTCFREEDGRSKCAKIYGSDLDEDRTTGKLGGKNFFNR